MLHDSICEIYEDTLTQRAEVTRQRIHRNSNDKVKHLGYIFLAKDKNSFDQSKCVRTYHTLTKVFQEYIQDLDTKKFEAPFITMNSFYRWGDRSKASLRWLNAVSIEIDNPEVTIADIHNLCNVFDLAHPSLAIKSPKGMHLHWKMERVRAFKSALSSYALISDALKVVFSRVGADAIGPERFWRMPTPWNTIFQHEDRFTMDELVSWAKSILHIQDEVASTATKKIVYLGIQKMPDILNHPAIQVILEGVPYGQHIRNRAAYTLALLMAVHSENNKAEAFSYLYKSWNPKNEKPISYRELKATVYSAYKGVKTGRIKGASEYFINFILKSMGSNLRFYYAKRSCYQGEKNYTKCSDLMEKIKEYIQRNGGNITISQRQLAMVLDSAFKSVQLALIKMKEMGVIEVKTVKGRNGGTQITLLPVKDQSLTEDHPSFDNKQCSQKVIPLLSGNSDLQVLSIISSQQFSMTIKDLHEQSNLSYTEFYATLMQLVETKQIRVVEPSGDGKFRFLHPPPIK